MTLSLRQIHSDSVTLIPSCFIIRKRFVRVLHEALGERIILTLIIGCEKVERFWECPLCTSFKLMAKNTYLKDISICLAGRTTDTDEIASCFAKPKTTTLFRNLLANNNNQLKKLYRQNFLLLKNLYSIY